MSEKFKVANIRAIHFITITIIDWVDLLTRPEYKHIIIESLIYCQKNKGLKIYAFVIMTSHIHLIASCEAPFHLPETIRDFKKFTSKKLVEAIIEFPESRKVWLLRKFAFAAGRIERGVNYKVWKDGFHPIELDSNKLIDEKLDYIHKNPVQEEIVQSPEQYMYSSAINYTGGKGIIDVELLI
jgi:putative transposase